MSITYDITTNFSEKDNLDVTDPDKVIYGTQFTTEFEAIKNAFAQSAPASTALTTSTTFGGDVSGTFDNIVVANDSHTHDTRYPLKDGTDATGTWAINISGNAITATAADVTTNLQGGIVQATSGSFTNDLAVDTDTLFVNASTDRVGIGTSSPTAVLHVNRPNTEGLVAKFDSANSTARSLEISSWNNSGPAGTGWDFNASSLGGALSFSVNEEYIVRINSSGIGVGTVGPSWIASGTQTNQGVLSLGTLDETIVENDVVGALSFKTNDITYRITYPDGVTGQIQSVSEAADGSAYGLGFITGNASGNRDEKVRINSSGNVNIAVGNGDGYGITFNSTSYNTSTTLDWYEDGFVFLEVADAITGGNVATADGTSCFYTRIGRVVYCSINIVNIDTTGLTAGNFLYLRNLPFSVLNGTGTTYSAAGAIQGINSSGTNERSSFGLAFVQGGSYCQLVASGEDSTIDLINVSDITSGSNIIRANVFYFAN